MEIKHQHKLIPALNNSVFIHTLITNMYGIKHFWVGVCGVIVTALFILL